MMLPPRMWMFSTILRSRKVYEIMAGVLVPEGQQLLNPAPDQAQAPTMWDRDQVAENITRFRSMTGQAATERFRVTLAQLVLAFFTTGALSSRLTRSSSAQQKAAAAAGGRRAGRKTGGRGRSGSGAR